MPEQRPRVAVLPGDDAAPEAVHPTLDLLKSMDLPIEWEVLPDGNALAAKSRDERETLIRDAIERTDTMLFGASSGLTGGVGYLRWGKDTYANVRPIRWIPGFRSPLNDPTGIDYVILRENIEDMYLGLEGDLSELTDAGFDLRPWRGLFGSPTGEAPPFDKTGQYAIKVITRENTERIARFACDLAMRRRARGRPGRVTCSSKYNVLRRSDGFFRSTVQSVVDEYGDVEYNEFIVDDLARRLVASPEQFDVIVMPNLYGDILSDVGAATIGGLGLAPSACYGSDYAYFEPVHGTAPDIAGQNTINPTATMLSAALMLEHLDFDDAARSLESAVERTYADGDSLTPDQGGSSTASGFTNAVRSRL